MNKVFQMFLNEAYRIYSRPAAIRRERARWTTLRAQDKPFAPRVYFGMDHVPTSDQPLSGGLVKCQDLQHVFPNTVAVPNLLYLVSSAPPLHADIMVRFAHEAGAKVVLNQNGVAYPAWHGKGWQKANQPLAHLHTQADYIFYQSQFCKLGAETYLGTTSAQSEILHNPVDTGRFIPPAATRPVDKPVLLMAGSHHFFYRIERAIETLRLVLDHHPGAILMIAGHCRWRPSESECRAEARDAARRKGAESNLLFSGAYTQDEAPALFQRAHVLLHTQYNDACPRLVVEAMACGVPVAYSATGGTPELIGNESGIGVPGPLDWETEHPPDPAQLAGAVNRILDNHEAFSCAARQHALDHFTLPPWLERHRVVFEELLK